MKESSVRRCYCLGIWILVFAKMLIAQDLKIKLELPPDGLKGTLSKATEGGKTPEVRLAPIPILPISAPAQLWMTARPFEKEPSVYDLRTRAAGELAELKFRLWLVSFNGLKTVLSFQGKSSASEDEVREARRHLSKYLELIELIELRTGEIAEAKRRRDERMRSIELQRDGPYVIHTSDASVVGRYYPQNQPSRSEPKEESKAVVPKGTHKEYYWTVDKALIKVGFDDEGKPTYRMGYDVVRKEREVADE